MELKYRDNATARHFRKLTKLLYMLTATNFWFEDLNLPKTFVRIYGTFSKFLEAIVITFVFTTIFARYTQHDLTEKQNTDVLMKSIGMGFAYTMYRFTLYRKEGVRGLLFALTVILKQYNDLNVERLMIRKTWMYSAGLTVVAFCPMSSYGIEGAVHALMSNATFTTIIPIWPDLEDRSSFAGFFRIFIYIIWLLLVVQIVSIYIITIGISICLGHQFTNLRNYFLSLNNIFEEEGSQKEKEMRYENAVKAGIKMHKVTLSCVHQLQSSCNVTYSGQVLMNLFMMVLLMIQMMQTRRSLLELAPIVSMAVGVLVSSGLVTWSAGDITFEAQRLPTAMFHSGWHNCARQSSVRVRKLITIAMAQAQQDVVIKGMGVINLSYESYVKIVKSSYSAFSVIY